MIRTLMLLALVAFLTGCSPSEKSLGPTAASAYAQDRQINVTWTWLDATHLQKTYSVVRQIHGQKVTIGPITVVYICDYPTTSQGPPAPGHCREDGTGCVDP